MSANLLAGELATRLLADCFASQPDNVDRLRFPDQVPNRRSTVRSWLKRNIFNIFGRLNYRLINNYELSQIREEMDKVCQEWRHLDPVYNLLCDDASRGIMTELLALRILGSSHVKLSSNNPRYWEAVSLLAGDELVRQRGTFEVECLGALNLYDLERLRYPIMLHAHPLNILCTFILQQYRYRKGSKEVRVEPGDVVIDAGGCWGDSALYFASSGDAARIFAFEFVPSNLDVLRDNLELNPTLKGKIEVVPLPVWDRSGELLDYVDAGPGTRPVAARSNGAKPVQTTTIDDFVRQRGLDRVDFIKMDIEGAELKALHGAEHTLREHRPKLAIALYHRPDDLHVIPSYLDNLRLGYEFYLDHFTIHHEETILFARTGSES